MNSRLSWLRAQAEQRLWPTGLLLTVLAGVATFANATGVYIGDNRYDQFASPGTRLGRSLFLWDGTRGLGRVREDLWLGLTAPIAVLRGLGLPVWAAERAFHAGLIALGGIGLVALVRVFRPRVGLGHLLGGLIYSFGPYSAVFLQPSNLYAAYAVAPWLCVVVLRAAACPTNRREQWRYAALFALAVFLLGNADPPGIVFVSLVVLPALAWSVYVERTETLRQAVRWVLKAGVLAVAVSLAVLFKTAVASATFSQRLDSTESPAIIHVASSWTETFRGVGFWASYFRGGSLARPQTEVLFSSPIVVFASCLVPILALLSFAVVRGRARVFLGATALLGAAVMVGSFSLGLASPYGEVITRLYGGVSLLSAFRSSYKVGALLMIGVAGLVALGLPELQRRWAAQAELRSVASAAVFLLVALTAVPFWSGNLYDTSNGFDHIPSYWTQAIKYVDGLPGAGRVLVLPGSTRTQYRWGWVGDDIIDAEMHRDHAVETAIPLSEPQAADLLHAITASVGDGTYQAGTLAPILRRLGIDRILIRNDLDWQANRTYRPIELDALRSDSDLHLLRTFGRQGQNTTRTTDRTDDAEKERRLPPVEVYELADPGPVGPRLVAAEARPLLLSGDGTAWPTLARFGSLRGVGPVRYTATLADRDLAAAVRSSSGVVVSDTNRRRVVTVNGFLLDEGPTLAAGQNGDRPAAQLFDRSGSQSVAWFADATRISATGATRGLQGSQPAVRPAAAFDGVPRTAWVTFESANQAGTRLRVDFRRPTVLSATELTAITAADGVNHITVARLRFSDGSSEVIPLDGRSGSKTFTRRTVRWVEIEVAKTSGGQPRRVGFTDISFPGVDLKEWVNLPDELTRRAKTDPEVAKAMAAAPLTLQMQRADAVAGQPVEPTLRRRFDLPAKRTFTVRATVTPSAAGAAALARTLAVGCRSNATMTVGGQPVQLRLVGSAADVKAGDQLRVEGCKSITVDAGWQALEVVGTPVTELRLESPGSGGGTPSSADPTAGGEPGGPASGVRVVSQGPGRYSLHVDAPAGGVLLSGQSWERRWVAKVNGRDLGAAAAYDTLSGWTLPKGRDLRVTLTYRPQQRFPAVLLLTGLAVAGCLVLAFRRRSTPISDGAKPSVG